MKINEFIGHCQCSWRFEKLKWMIETKPIDEINDLYRLHQSCKRNFKYDELEVEFQKRFATQ